MDPSNRPQSNINNCDEPVSPRTCPHNYTATLNNNSLSLNAGPDTGRFRRSSAPPYTPKETHQQGKPCQRLIKTRILQYTGHTLGKRGNQRYLLPPPPKRRCLHSERAPSDPSLQHLSSYPDIYPTADRDQAQRANPFVTTYHTDPDLSRLPLTALEFASIVLPPEPERDWIAAIGFGNDNPASTNHRNLNVVGVHPLFRQLLRPAHDGCNSWHNSRAFPDLWRAAQLATRFLSNQHTLAFFHKILFQEPALLERESEFYGVDVLHLAEAPEDTYGLTQQQKTVTTDALAALAPHIAIAFATGADTHAATTWAYTTRVPSSNPTATLTARRQRHKPLLTARTTPPPAQSTTTFIDPAAPSPADIAHPHAWSPHHLPVLDSYHPQTALVRSLGFRGTNARIALSPLFLRLLHRHSHAPTPPFHARQYALFFLAVTLVHEVAHAAWMCRWPAPAAAAAAATATTDGHPAEGRKEEEEYEPFVGSHRRAELGHAWEASVFGGNCVEVLGQRAASAGGADRDWSDVFSLGVGVRTWPDGREQMVRCGVWEGVVPLARLVDDSVDAGDCDLEVDESSGELACPKAQSGDRWETLRIVPFRFVAGLFQEAFWEWADDTTVRVKEGRDVAAGGCRPRRKREVQQEVVPPFRRWMERQVRSWVGVRFENVDWNMLRGARPGDYDVEMEGVRAEEEEH